MANFFFSPVLNAQISDDAGVPLDGGLIYTYLAYTTTPVATYKTILGVEHSNPIVLDATGNFPDGSQLWLRGGAKYRFVVKDKNLNTLTTLEGIIGINDIEEQDGGDSEFLWVQYEPVASPVSISEFSVVGDQLQVFQAYNRVYLILGSTRCYATIESSYYAGGMTNKTIVKLNFDTNAEIYGDNLHGVYNSIILPRASPVSPLFNGLNVVGDAVISGVTRVAPPTLTDSAVNVASISAPNNQMIKKALNSISASPVFGLSGWVNIGATNASGKIEMLWAGGNIATVTYDNNQASPPFLYYVNFVTPMFSANYSVTGSCSTICGPGMVPIHDAASYIVLLPQAQTANHACFYIGCSFGPAQKGQCPAQICLTFVAE